MRILEPLKTLRQPLFRRLYIAQGISLLGDSITWLGVALLAYEFGGAKSAQILSVSLTLRVTAFVIFGSYAGIIADRYSRKKIMIITNLFRMVIVVSFAFLTATWQLYLLIFLLNIFNSFFSPAYKATVPQLVSGKENYGNAIALSNATWQLLGILGPGLAGILAVAWGARQIFLIDAFTFIISSILVFFIPISNTHADSARSSFSLPALWNDMKTGTKLVFGKHQIRFALMIELAAALAGAQVMVNTIGRVKTDMLLGDDEYGFIMAAFGAGATVAAFTSSTLDKSKDKSRLLISGALMLGLAVAFASFAPFNTMVILWVIAGLGISYADMPSQILIAENIDEGNQGKAYGSHFAWTHVWWATGYIIAGITGTWFRNVDFVIGGILALVFLGLLTINRHRKQKAL
jgi:NRE family putative nickel resistance protein-like MFS transporter